VIPPEGAVQDSEIFLRLLAATGDEVGYSSAGEIFAAISQQVSAYKNLDYHSIGAQGIELVNGGGGAS
jgi:hypothetical protein